MGKSDALKINIDGGSRGNPGPAAFAYVIQRSGEPDIEGAGRLPPTTNNIAEYTALVRALERAAELKGKKLVIRSDSELLVKQMNGMYKVKHPNIKPLYEQAQDLLEKFDSVTIVHVLREQNQRADQLCNDAMDGIFEASDPPGARSHSSRLPPFLDPAHREALACLRSAAKAWSDGDPAALTPEEVWRDIWTCLDRNGVVSSPRTE